MRSPEDLFSTFRLSFDQVIEADIVIAFDEAQVPVLIKNRYGTERAGYWRTNEALENALNRAKANNMAILVTLVPAKEERK